MAAVPIARLEGAGAVVAGGEADRLHRRLAVGTPDGPRLRLAAVEAAWLAGQGRVEVREGLDPVGLVHLLADGPAGRAEVEYLAYRDLRERGLVPRVAAEPGTFDVLPRGGSPGDAPAYTLHVEAERSAVDAAALGLWAAQGDAVGLVDEDGVVTHYRLALESPRGVHPPSRHLPVAGVLLHDRVLVAGADAAQSLHRSEFVGTPGDGGLFLSLVEAEALRRRGVLAVEGDLASRASLRGPAFPAILAVYEALRAAGVVAKSGFRFGTHLRGYRGDPEEGHAEWLVHCTGGAGLEWSDLSRGVRLAHGVRKAFALGWSRPDGVRFIGLSWFRA